MPPPAPRPPWGYAARPSRPRSVRELTSDVVLNPVRNEESLSNYYWTAEHELRQARVYQAEGNEAMHFTKLYTFVRRATRPRGREGGRAREGGGGGGADSGGGARCCVTPAPP